MVRILVIEDEQSIRENIVEILELNRYEVQSAANGDDGVKIASQYQPDLILCDIMMKGMDGYGVLDSVRHSPAISLTPFIFLTAKSDRSSMRYGMESGADDYIPKPFTNEELLSAINSRLDRFNEVGDQANEQLTTTKKQLAHVISHELRTPLTSINMAIQLMSQQLDFLSKDDIHDLVDTLGSGTNRLNRLVEQITLFVQAQTGLMEPEKVQRSSRQEALWALILGAINRAQHFVYRENNVQVNYDTKENHLEIPCFRDLMIHALAEIISNAISFSPENGVVDISVKEFDDSIGICIEDHGKGMTASQIDAAGVDFRQVDREQFEQQGVGIGLPLANMIVQAHGGKLEVQSKVGVGTQVYIYLPIE